MGTYVLEVIVENKPSAKDPEGETIMRDLMHRNGFESVKKVRTGKYLRIEVEAENKEQARELVFKMCNDLRIFNPVIHVCNIREADTR